MPINIFRCDSSNLYKKLKNRSSIWKVGKMSICHLRLFYKVSSILQNISIIDRGLVRLAKVGVNSHLQHKFYRQGFIDKWAPILWQIRVKIESISTGNVVTDVGSVRQSSSLSSASRFPPCNCPLPSISVDDYNELLASSSRVSQLSLSSSGLALEWHSMISFFRFSS